jgi:hypothetical protein
MKKIGIFSICILLFTLVLALSANAAATELGEYEIKSGMLYNFTYFIEWPAESLDKTRTLNVCIAGNNSSKRSFYRLHGKSYKDRSIVVRQISEPDSTSGCNLLFLHRSEHNQLSEYLEIAQKRSILTVSDMDDFAAHGGIIGFIEQDGKIRFEINLDVAQKAKIKISSQLLKLARIVAGRK